MRIKNTIKSLLKNLHSHKKSEPDIYIFSLPRTGSTLLAEILNTDSNSKTASESLSLTKDNIQVLRKYFNKDVLSERYVDVSEQSLHEIIEYYELLAEGKTWNSYYWSDFLTSNHSFKTTRTIFKTHKVTYYFDELMGHFNNDYGIYLLRHPVSHALSRLRKGWDSYISIYATAKKIKNIIPHKAILKIREVNATGSDLEKFVVSWCLENYIFIHSHQNNSLPPNILPVFYEELVTNPEVTLKNICAKIKMKYTKEMANLVSIPSSGTIHSTNETKDQIIAGNKNFLINRWKETLDINTEKELKSILVCFGIHLYLE